MTQGSVPALVPGRRRPFADRLITLLLAISAMTSSWTGVVFFGVPIYDATLLLALILLSAGAVTRGRSVRLPLWMLMPSLCTFGLLCFDVIVRGDALGGELSAGAIMIRILLTTTAIGIALLAEADHYPRSLRLVGAAWAIGATMSSAAAWLADISVIDLTSFVAGTTGDRAYGLAAHPNTLAFTSSIAIPVLVCLVLSGRQHLAIKLAATIGLILNVNALLLADSRAGLIVGVGAGVFVAVAALFLSGRPALGSILVLTLVIAAVTWLPALIASTRLGDGTSTAASNDARAAFADESLRLFSESPFVGAGLGEMVGVSVPLLLLSGGGIVLLVGYLTFPVVLASRLVGGATSAMWSMTGLIVVVGVLVFGLLNNGYAERASFWIPLCIAGYGGLLAHRRRSQTEHAPGLQGVRG